jgi:hypothetical protein
MRGETTHLELIIRWQLSQVVRVTEAPVHGTSDQGSGASRPKKPAIMRTLYRAANQLDLTFI